MFFSKKNRDERKRLKEEKREAVLTEKELSKQISEAEQEAQTQVQETVLTKEIKAPQEEKTSFFGKFKRGLSKTKQMFTGSLDQLAGEDPIDDDFIEDLEERLLGADLGFPTTEKIINIIEEKHRKKDIQSQTEAIETVKKVISEILDQGDHTLPLAESGPTVYLFVGVNGVGKTTSIGKLAAKFNQEGKKVLVAAGDTFRAAAIEQLKEWAIRADVDIIANASNSDPAATMYEAAEMAVAGNYDILLCDTAGRLQTKKNLMDELDKMQRVIKKVIPDAPHASILTLDANTGQNAIIQTKEFSKLIGLDGLIVTKLDGTAKGGVIIGIVNEFEIPVYYIGVGEAIDDLQPFSPRLFADSLFEKEKGE
ncbi:MAG: signal recognition particle-docking protein FtsY [SAR324 cluster bacterium]|uniref:Signal recognition particle receptor FtsY n=1 Tax=SAR324 cluster bacterium TaxID=2024889 RepID=A0A2A4T2P8_9DELT|nr:MAG: signal recognition particle-docking protein FtsY [SAR324 cluster bacterium]